MLSQFEPAEGRFVPTTLTGQTEPSIRVSGPLNLTDEHGLPIAIHVMVVQSPKDDHDPAHATVSSNVVVVREAARTWEGTVPRRPEFRKGEARAIAVAVVPIGQQFAYETLTWCEHIELTDPEAAA